MNLKIYKRANEILKEIYGAEATFREGQYEAIESVLTRKRTVVVQKTGWGKSLVYFVASRMISELRGGSITIIISPLLVLMDNQRILAENAGLKCAIINSRVKNEERKQLLKEVIDQQYNVIFTTPETLYTDDLQRILYDLNIGLFVVDECHCISDWGHDFRLEYGKLNRIISSLPDNVAVLGTTATANDRVVEDLKKQFGDGVFVSRGSLSRDNLHIEILHIEDKAERYAWIIENIEKLPGAGIIYCLTKRDCKNLSDFLCDNGISARAYYSDKELDGINEVSGTSYNEDTEKLFAKNKIKVVVATIKLGMGYDKEDVGFVIHFQQPGSLVAYYQQIGRAGRKKGTEAYCYMMVGQADKKISKYFIETAFPTKQQELEIVEALTDRPDGMTKKQLDSVCNISKAAFDKTINMLLNRNIIYQEGKLFFRSLNEYKYDLQHYEAVKKEKYKELKEMDLFTGTTGCLSRFVVSSLNDDNACDCGKCSNCIGRGILDGISVPNERLVNSIKEKLNSLYIKIEPRKMWPMPNDLDVNTRISKINETGIALAKYNDPGYGEMVANDKYNAYEYRNELIEKSVAVITEKLQINDYTVVTSVPSLRNDKVERFARILAEKLGIKYEKLLKKKPNHYAQQKEMQNSYYQCKNALESIEIEDDEEINGKVILIDDMVDSRWTLTVCGRLLTKNGAESVFPFCLADSSMQGDD